MMSLTILKTCYKWMNQFVYNSRLSLIYRNPSSSKYPTSPVRSQPSFVTTASVASKDDVSSSELDWGKKSLTWIAPITFHNIRSSPVERRNVKSNRKAKNDSQPDFSYRTWWDTCVLVHNLNFIDRTSTTTDKNHHETKRHVEIIQELTCWWAVLYNLPPQSSKVVSLYW